MKHEKPLPESAAAAAANRREAAGWSKGDHLGAFADLWLKRVAILALAFVALPIQATTIECITNETTETVTVPSGTVKLSRSAIRARSKSGVDYVAGVYSNEDAEVDPVTCTAKGPTGDRDGTAVTCNGFDTSGSYEIWTRCDPNSPWAQVENTTTYTAAVKIGRWRTAQCDYRLRIVDPGAGDQVCFSLSFVGADFPEDEFVQDEDDKSNRVVTEFN